jgi:alkaline phosphatase D
MRTGLRLLVASAALVGLGARQPSVTFTHGVACGDASDSQVVLWTRTDQPTTLVPELLDPTTSEVQRSLPPVQTTPDADLTVKTLVDGLTPREPIAYRFRGPGGESSPTGACRTAPLPDAPAQVTFGFSGDADWKWRPYPLVEGLVKEPLDFFFFLGDLIYEDTSPDGSGATVAESLSDYRAKYRQNREARAGSERPSLQPLYARFGIYAVFDNHETGQSKATPSAPPYTEGGAPAGDGVHTFVNQTPGFEDRLRAFSEYNPLRDRRVSGTGDPRLDGTRQYYFSQPLGSQARLIVTDDRSYRDRRLRNSEDPDADNPNRTILGAPQLAWLEDELLSAQQAGVIWKFVVVSSPIQRIGRMSEIGVDLDGSKSWAGGYRAERQRLLQFIDSSGVDNVVFLTTDNHDTMINNLGARNAFEILTGPIGAGAGPPVNAPSLSALPHRDAERLIGSTLADLQRRAGLDPIGLEPGFPGLLGDTVVAQGAPPGTVEPQAFASFNTYAYAVLSVDGPRLDVRVVGIPIVDFHDIDAASGLAAYQAETPQEILRFAIQAQ